MWRIFSFAKALIIFTAGVLLGEPAQAAGVVTTCTESSLRAAMAGGGLVTFGCDGTITLASTITNTVATVLDGSGHQVTISGNNARRVFVVNTNGIFAISNLTIANGKSDNGAGIYNAGGHLILQNCILANHATTGPDGPAYSGSPGTNGSGGAVYSSGLLTAINCTFISNSVAGGAGAAAAWPSNPGAAGGHGNGGAIGNFGTLIMTGCVLVNNSSRGGAGGDGGAGPYGYPFPYPGGPGGTGGDGNGGALFNNGSAFLFNNTFALNWGIGGQGGVGGSGSPPSSQSSSSGDGGHGGNGGSGYSAIYDVNGQLYLTNCTLALNPTTQGTGGNGGPAGPWIYPYPPHTGQPGGNGYRGSPGGGLKTEGAFLLNSLLSGNTPSNCIGSLTDAGHNLSSDGSCAFIGMGSVNNIDPKLGLLVNNGGTTLTMALLPGSPAIDAGTAIGAPATDQRGISRPQGRGVDIGAYEFQFTIPQITDAQRLSPSNFWLRSCGLPNQTYTLETSTNLLTWSAIITAQSDENGLCEFLDFNLGNRPARFYRLKSTEP